jgi:hypothetical protein
MKVVEGRLITAIDAVPPSKRKLESIPGVATIGGG